MRFWLATASLSIAAWGGWFLYGVEASKPLGPTSAALTVGSTFLMGGIPFAAIWFLALVVWSLRAFRAYAKDRRRIELRA